MSSATKHPSSSNYNELHASAILLTVAFGLLVVSVGWTFANVRQTIKSDRILLYAAALSLPFLAVRDIYNILQSFQVNTSLFNSIIGSVVVYAFMAIFMEFIVVILYLGAGWRAPKIDRELVKTGNLFGSKEKAQR